MKAPFLIEAAVNGEVFAKYVEKVLCPGLIPFLSQRYNNSTRGGESVM
jgi:hypothetical protein